MRKKVATLVCSIALATGLTTGVATASPKAEATASSVKTVVASASPKINKPTDYIMIGIPFRA
ncbi:hypothetical protein [Streptomyces sp. NBC_01012]|uniref:hypothetical protein n=1 Tax=Streptomyces sp. NBC_01012 TaxID=2903717 RepID=UPI0038642D57|nr:hypothetical protein OG623_18090 [Streptomyces sp. NBC_01012]